MDVIACYNKVFFPVLPPKKKKRLDEGNKEKKKKGVGGVIYAL